MRRFRIACQAGRMLVILINTEGGIWIHQMLCSRTESVSIIAILFSCAVIHILVSRSLANHGSCLNWRQCSSAYPIAYRTCVSVNVIGPFLSLNALSVAIHLPRESPFSDSPTRTWFTFPTCEYFSYRIATTQISKLSGFIARFLRSSFSLVWDYFSWLWMNGYLVSTEAGEREARSFDVCFCIIWTQSLTIATPIDRYDPGRKDWNTKHHWVEWARVVLRSLSSRIPDELQLVDTKAKRNTLPAEPLEVRLNTAVTDNPKFSRSWSFV